MTRLRNLMASILMLLAFITVPVTDPAAATDPNLVGLWHMDGDWLDSSGIGNNGSPHNGVTFGNDVKVGSQSARFDGVNDYVTIQNNTSLNFGKGDFSVEYWMKVNDTLSTDTQYGVINKNSTGVKSPGWGMELSTYGSPSHTCSIKIFISSQNLWGNTSAYAVINVNTWYHVVGIRQGTLTKIYINGELKAIKNHSDSALSVDNTVQLIIGKHSWGPYFPGLIDEVAIYNRALSDAEIIEHFRKDIVKSPSVNPVPSPTATPTITLSGNKPANTAIVVNGNIMVPLDGATVWQANYTLTEGTNDLTITALDSQNYSSLPVTLTVVLDSTPPVAPTIDPVSEPINSASITISGTRSSDSSGVVVSCAGATIDTVYYPTTTTWFVNVSGLQEGGNNITAYAVDAAGNRSATAMATINVDTSPPAVGATPVGGIYNSTQMVTITASEPADIYYTTDGSTPTESAAIYGQPIAIPVSATLRFFGRDLAGNSGEIATENYVIDTTPPVLSISTLGDGAYTNNETLNIAGMVTDDTDVTGITINGTDIQANSDGSFSYALLLDNGANIITVTATDSAGNMATDTRTVTLDQTAPILEVTEPADNSKTGNVLLEVSGTVDNTSYVTIKMKDTVQNTLMDGGAFTATIVLEPGYNTIEITATDLAMNQSSLKRTVLYDDQKPSLAIIEPNQDIRTNQSGLTIKGTVNDTLTTVGVTIGMDNGLFEPPVINDTFEQTVNFTEEKTYNIIVTATNEVGTSTSVQRNVIYDITPPVLSIDPVTTPTNQSSQSVSGAREAGTEVTVTCATASVGEVSYPTEVTWQTDISGLTEGENVITASSVDGAGNAITASATIVLSSRLPEITIRVTPDIIWPPNRRMVPVRITGGVDANGSTIKSVSISLRDEYGKIRYNNLRFGSTVMLEAWRKGNDTDGRKYTITVVVTNKWGISVAKTATVTVPHEDPNTPRKAARGFCRGRR